MTSPGGTPLPLTFKPVRIDEAELAKPLPRLGGGSGELGIAYGGVECLVRLHGEPLGFVHVEPPPDGLEPAALAALIWTQLEKEIQDHLKRDGLPVPATLGASGVPQAGAPPCRAERERLAKAAPFVSLVIPTRNRPASAAATLARIAAGDYPRDRYEAIVVDNGSGSDARFEIDDLDLPGEVELRVVREPAAGGSNARNRGLIEARGEIVVFADDDVDADAEWLGTMVAPFVGAERARDPCPTLVRGLRRLHARL
jgi:hypothetical protein